MKYKDYIFNCDSLWKLWYSVLVILIQMLIIALAISNYMTFREQAFSPRYGGDWNIYPMYIQLTVIIISISVLIFLIYSCIFKVGNIANDGVELGLDPQSIQKALDDISANKGFAMLLSRFKSHFLPYNCLIHVIIALLTLLPVPLMHAEQIRNEVMAKKWIWQTDLDFMMNPYAQYLRTGNQDPTASVPRDNTLCLPHRPCRYPMTPAAIQPEHVNLIVALLIITIRIATPFWYTNKAFSIVFSLYSFVTSVCIIFSYQAVEIFVKIAHNDAIRIVASGEAGETSLISGWWVLVLFLVKSLLMCAMTLLVFEYGYSQYVHNMRKYRQYFNYDMSDSVSQQSLGARSDSALRWLQAAPRISAFVVLLAVAVVEAPLVMAFVRLHTAVKVTLPVVWLGVLAPALYLLVSIFFWFGLCMKSDWCFRINLQTGLKVGGKGVGGSHAESPEPVYGCFYTAPASLASSGKIALRSSLDGGGSRNYVYMQPTSAAGIQERMAASMMAAGSEVSCGSNPRSYDSYDGFSRYKPACGGRGLSEQGPYSTLAALKAGRPPQTSYGIDQSGPYTTLATLKSSRPPTVHSESSASSLEAAAMGPSFSRSSTRRGSNRVTFREEHNVTIDSADETAAGVPPQDFYSYPPRPDILDMTGTVPTSADSGSGGVFFPTDGNELDVGDEDDEDDGTDKFHPDLEMSTDMRQMKASSTAVSSSNDKDPRMCSRV